MDILRALGLIIYHALRTLCLLFVPSSYLQKDVSQDVVLVTGAGSGIGRELALEFAKLGSTLVLWDVNSDGNEETAKQARISGCKEVHTFRVDITDRGLVYHMAEKVSKSIGKVTILVNNAGIVNGNSGILETPDDKIERLVKVNTISHFWTIKAFMPDMIKCNRGHIVSIASYAGIGGTAYQVDYAASKFAAVGLMESLRMELLDQGRDFIKTTTVCPFYVNTGMFDGVTCDGMGMCHTSQVVKQIMNGVLTNEVLVFIPTYARYVGGLKLYIPVHALRSAYECIGVFKSMKSFKGRES